MATAKHNLIIRLDAAAHRLDVDMKERGLNRRLLSLFYSNTVWDITPDGDKVQIKAYPCDSSVPLWTERRAVEDVIGVMEAIARRRGAGQTAQ
jgi:hypothetical protein